jgi:ABC-type glutathione transport system ATPase component
MCVSVDYPDQKHVLRDAALEVHPGEIVGLAGESGSGKSTLALTVLRLLEYTGARVTGRISVSGIDILACDERQMRAIRGRFVSYIPQSATAAFNPALSVGTQIREAWRAHSREPWSHHEDRIRDLLVASGLPGDKSFLKRLPNNVSVGQAQRLLMVMALLHAPQLVIADEPTSSLDMITQSDVLDLLWRLRGAQSLGMLFISHDLRCLRALCDRISVLYQGRIVESEAAQVLLQSPQHPYTRQLVAAMQRW